MSSDLKRNESASASASATGTATAPATALSELSDAEKVHHVDLTDSNVIDKYRIAGEIANNAVKHVISKAQAGTTLLDLSSEGDRYIEEATAKIFNQKQKDGSMIQKGVAFPTSINVNQIVGHYSPLKTDSKNSIKEGDVMKIDLGVHIDGYVVTAADTMVVGNGQVSGRVADALTAAHTAAQAALRLLRPGTVNSQISEVIQSIGKDYGVTPVAGVLSHQMNRYQIDGKELISQRPLETGIDGKPEKVAEYTIKPNEIWALDIVMSTGEGKPRPSADHPTTIYSKQDTSQYAVKGKITKGLPRCFGAGVEVMMADGSSRIVEALLPGDSVMGDDLQPRQITQFFNYPWQGQQATDQLYRVTPYDWKSRVASSLNGKQQKPLIVNGEHILVLTVTDKPFANNGRGTSWKIVTWALRRADEAIPGLSDHLIGLPFHRYSPKYDTKEERDAALRKIQENWEPLVFECTVQRWVDDVINGTFAFSIAKVTKLSKVTKPKNYDAIANTMPYPFRYLNNTTYQENPMPEAWFQRHEIASRVRLTMWLLGLWLADGNTGHPIIAQGGPPDHTHKFCHLEVFRRCQLWASLFPGYAEYQKVLQHVSPKKDGSPGNPVYNIKFGTDNGVNLFREVLQHYAIYNNKRIPPILMNESVENRMWFLAGIIDGDGHYQNKQGLYRVYQARRNLVKQIKELCLGLGLCVGNESRETFTDDDGVETTAYGIHFSGTNLIDISEKLAITYKKNHIVVQENGQEVMQYRRPLNNQPDPTRVEYRGGYQRIKAENTWPFNIAQAGVGAYFGFTIQPDVNGNHRFLLADGTVTHNSGKITKEIMNVVDKKYSHFPFTMRSLSDKEANVKFAIREMREHNVVEEYVVLNESRNDIVTHVKYTVMIRANQTDRIAGMDVDLSKVETDKKVTSENALKALALEIPKKESKKDKKKQAAPSITTTGAASNAANANANAKAQSESKSQTLEASKSPSPDKSPGYVKSEVHRIESITSPK